MVDATGLVGVGECLLLYDEPAVTEAFGTYPEAPMQVQPWSDLADGALDELQLIDIAEPHGEGGPHLFCAVPLEVAGREKGAHVHVGAQRACQMIEVLCCQALEQGVGPRVPGDCARSGGTGRPWAEGSGRAG